MEKQRLLTTTADTASTKSKTTSLYPQGMDGDRTKAGSTQAATTAGIDLAGLDVRCRRT